MHRPWEKYKPEKDAEELTERHKRHSSTFPLLSTSDINILLSCIFPVLSFYLVFFFLLHFLSPFFFLFLLHLGVFFHCTSRTWRKQNKTVVDHFPQFESEWSKWIIGLLWKIRSMLCFCLNPLVILTKLWFRVQLTYDMSNVRCGCIFKVKKKKVSVLKLCDTFTCAYLAEIIWVRQHTTEGFMVEGGVMDSGERSVIFEQPNK